VPHQAVFEGKVVAQVGTQAAGPQDTMVAMPRPVAAKLSELGLSGTLFQDSATTNPADRKDQLMVFDNAAAALNKAPSATYFRIPAGWVRDTSGYPPAENVTIEPSAGVLIRKAAAGNNAGVTWLNVPNYDVTAP
jgi:uncharacterized protein (TIGR02597 family)